MKTVGVKTVVAVAAAASVLLVGIWYFAFWSSQSKQLSSAHKQHAAAEAQVRSLTTQAASLGAILAQIPGDEAKLEVLEQELPNTPSFDQALRDLQQAAVSSGANLTDVSPTPPSGVVATSGSSSGSSSSPATSILPSIQLALSAAGSPQQVTSFLADLEGLPRTLEINTLSLSGTTGKETASITARIFYDQTAPVSSGSSSS